MRKVAFGIAASSSSEPMGRIHRGVLSPDQRACVGGEERHLVGILAVLTSMLLPDQRDRIPESHHQHFFQAELIFAEKRYVTESKHTAVKKGLLVNCWNIDPSPLALSVNCFSACSLLAAGLVAWPIGGAGIMAGLASVGGGLFAAFCSIKT